MVFRLCQVHLNVLIVVNTIYCVFAVPVLTYICQVSLPYNVSFSVVKKEGTKILQAHFDSSYSVQETSHFIQ